jgi:hypothetical protein
MSPIAISFITLAFVFGGALFGIFLRVALPQNHVISDSKDIVKLGMGFVGTMAALVLGLLIASAKSSFDTQSAELTEMSSKLVLLDRVLAHYGPEARESRDLVRAAVGKILDGMELQARTRTSHSDPISASSEVLYDKVQGLVPTNDAQRTIQGQALSLVIALGQMRWLIYAQQASSISMPLLVVLIFWLTIIFVSFGLFAPVNPTVLTSLFVTALSFSGAIFLILEMYTPYGGLIQVSSAPLRAALAHLGQ